MKESLLLLKDLLELSETKSINILLQYQKMCISIDFIIQLKIQQYISQHNQKKAVSLKSKKYVAFNKRNNKEDHKFKDGDHVTISTYKKCFAKVYVPNWSEEDF